MPNPQHSAPQIANTAIDGEPCGDPTIAYRSYLAGDTKSIWQLTNGILGKPILQAPREVSVKASFIDGDEATLEITGQIEGSAICGRVVLRRYAGGWRVSSEAYIDCAPEGYCLNIA